MRGGDTFTLEQRAKMSAGAHRALVGKRAYRAAAIARAIEWRERRRCPDCGALGFETCAHRPGGADGEYLPTPTMPFAGHRTVAEVWEMAALRESRAGSGHERGSAAGHGSHLHNAEVTTR